MAKLPQVDSVVPLQVIFQANIMSKGLHTVVAAVRLLTCVLSHVILHVGSLCETTVARRAFVRLFGLMDRLVLITVLLGIKLLATDAALVRPARLVPLQDMLGK